LAYLQIDQMYVLVFITGNQLDAFSKCVS